MSSHREAPEISKDPVADSTDLYAFVSPDEPDTVTIIANYVPLEGPDGGRQIGLDDEFVFGFINVDGGGPRAIGLGLGEQAAEGAFYRTEAGEGVVMAERHEFSSYFLEIRRL